MACELCNDAGGAYRRRCGEGWTPAKCDGCGTVGTARSKQLNAIDEKRAAGKWSGRLESSPYERAMHDVWLDELRPALFLNHGQNKLELLLQPEEPTERDYLVAATVIQWLGSNIGRAFMEQAQQLGDVYAKADADARRRALMNDRLCEPYKGQETEEKK